MQVTMEGLERIKAANELSAVVAERGIKLQTNVLIASLAATEPSLLDAMLSLTPEESCVRYSAIVGKG